MTSNNISITSCFLFLLNIIIGTGVFLNTSQLFFLLNKYSYLAYIVTGFLMIPIISITYILANENPGFNLTRLFTKYFGEWNTIFVPLYALSKFATSVIGMIFISTLIKALFFSQIVSFYLNVLFFLFIYSLCVFLVYYDISINNIIQKLIISVKIIPLVGIIILFFYYFFYDSLFSCSHVILHNVYESFDFFKLAQGASITIFAFAGFESLFAINHLLIGNTKKGPWLLGISFFCALILYVLYQFCISYLACFFLVQTQQVISFLSFLQQCFGHILFANIFILFINIAIMVSSLGVAHGIMYVTVNNLYSSMTSLFITIKKAKYFVFLLVPFYAYIGINNIFILQQFSSLGTIITYGMFVLMYYQIKEKNNILFYVALLSIFVFLFAHIYNAFNYFGFTGYCIYAILLVLLYFNFFFKRYLL